MSYQQTGFPGQQAQQQQQQQQFQQQQPQFQQQQFQQPQFQQQPLQQQVTGYSVNLQGFTGQQGIPPVPSIPTGLTFSQSPGEAFSPQPQQQQAQQSQPTDQHKKSQSQTKIPTIRLSFITVSDQAKFEQLFKAAVGDGQALSGE
jgi:hypothetical protein